MYLALYRKYRPKSFEDVISQPHITKTLANEVKTKHIAHAYLFTGSRGTGKTSCARIFAKAINCQSPKEGEPCLECDICKGIDSGSLMDVVEIDAASNNGVDSIRELRDEANFTPSVCKFRVYIIDEAHMLSSGAFNALLKILEEPPSHVVFILATTEIHKVPATIISRCQRFDFRRIKASDITDRLLHISRLEKINLDTEAAELISRIADGGMRDALSLLDQCISFSKDIDTNVVNSAAGVAAKKYLFDLGDAITGRDSSKALFYIDELYKQSKDLERLCEEMINHYRNIMLAKTVDKCHEIISASPEEIKQLKEVASNTDLSQIIHCLEVFQDTLEKLNKVANKRLELEVCMIKLCDPKLDSAIDSLVRRVESIEKQLTGKVALQGLQQTVPKDEITKTSLKQNQKSTNAPPKEKPRPDNTNTLHEQESDKPNTPLDQGLDTPNGTTQKPKPLECWSDILEDISEFSPVLHSILRDSYAFELDDRLFIQSPNTAFASKIESRANDLNDIIFKHTGKKYRLLMKGSRPQGTTSAVDDIISKAKQNGIDVEIK